MTTLSRDLKHPHTLRARNAASVSLRRCRPTSTHRLLPFNRLRLSAYHGPETPPASCLRGISRRRVSAVEEMIKRPSTNRRIYVSCEIFRVELPDMLSYPRRLTSISIRLSQHHLSGARPPLHPSPRNLLHLRCRSLPLGTSWPQRLGPTVERRVIGTLVAICLSVLDRAFPLNVSMLLHFIPLATPRYGATLHMQ